MKSFFKINLIYIIIFELIFQFFIFFDFKYFKIPDLFYNGYCSQKYWNFVDKEISFKDKTKYHPILSYIKKDIEIPENFNEKFYIEENFFNEKKISLYGSSYINHKEFKFFLDNNKNYSFNNYALNSYGLDQIFLSYKLTAHLNQNKTIIFGFLLEDLDRSIFYKRDYEKVLIKKDNEKYSITNIPIKQKDKSSFKFDFYLLRFLSNFYSLIKNDFDPRLSNCHIDKKKDLLNYYFDEILSLSSKYNQKIIFVTFNLKEDLLKTPTWRYDAVKNLITKNNITHLDSYSLLKKKSSNKNEEINSYFGIDKHNNKKSFKYIVDDLFSKL